MTMTNKTVTIKNATDEELRALLDRLRNENELQNLIISLRRKSLAEPGNIYEGSFRDLPVSTETPIGELYHFGIPGMRWGHRKGSSSSTKGLSKSASKSHFLRSVEQKYGKKSAKSVEAAGKKVSGLVKKHTKIIQSALRKSKVRKLNDVISGQDKNHSRAVNTLNFVVASTALAIVTYKVLEKYS